MVTSEAVTGSERRAHTRHEVDLAAEIIAGGRTAPACRIRDICLGGVLVQCTDEVLPAMPAPGRVCDIRFRLPVNGAERELELRSEVVRPVEGGFGARFSRPRDDALGVLRAFLAERNRAPAADPGRGPVQRVIARHLDGLVEGLLDRMESDLWASGERAATDRERAGLIADLSSLLRARRKGGLSASLRRALTVPHPVEAWVEDAGNLELIEKDRFEVWLAKAALVKRLDESLGPTLDPVRRAMGGWSFPVDPQGIADALETALDPLDLSAGTRVLCLRAAGAELPRPLEPLYRELASVLPAPAGAPKTAPRPGPRPLHSRSSTATPLAASLPLDAAQAADLLLNLPAGPAACEGGALGLLTEAAGAPPPLPVRERVEATERVLAGILEQPGLPNEMKEWVQRLTGRILATAVLEPGFFEGDGHPLLRLIDQLEHLAMFLGHRAVADGLQQDVETLLQQALDTDGRDRATLDGITGRLEQLERRHGDSFRRNAERVVAGCEGRERVRDARRGVRQRINDSLAGRRMHRTVGELIDHAWRPLLQLVHMREGGDAPGFLRRWTVLVEVHEACGGDVSEYAAVRDLRSLLAAIQEGLAYIGFDPFLRSSLLGRVETALREVRSGTSDPDGDYLAYPPIPEDPEAQSPREVPPEGQDPASWYETLAQVDALPVGTPLTLDGPDGPRMLRLAWRSRDGTELVALDSRGLQAGIFHPAELTSAILQGRTRPSAPAEGGLAARATEAVLDEMRARIVYHETHDSLTGLMNRRQLLGTLTQELAGGEDGRNQALGFMEVDQLEAVNSTCGYLAGEKLLVAVAKMLENSVGEDACLAYLGGSRFALLVPAANDGDAVGAGERLRGALAGLPFVWNGDTYPVTASLGFVLAGREGEGPEALLSSADAACQAAQRAGGDRVVLFREEDEGIARQREDMHWWVKAESAVKAERLRLRCQLIAPAVEGPDRPHHHEILLSAFDEQDQPLSLGRFIGAAEAFNLMAEVDRQVIRKAFDWLAQHPGHRGMLGGIALNLSGQSLGDPTLVDYIRVSLAERDIPPEFVSFEVTETAAIANLDRAVAIIEGIKVLGCRFALDDFGTGMSSYSYLKRLPVDYLKIDGSFVKDILNNPHDLAIVKSINEIAHFMGKETIAEYVENEAIAAKLRELGVDFLQGYAVEKPLFLDDLG